MTTKAKIALGLSLVVVMLSAATQRGEALPSGGEICDTGFHYFPNDPCDESNFCEIKAWEFGCGHVNYQGCFDGYFVCSW